MVIEIKIVSAQNPISRLTFLFQSRYKSWCCWRL